MSHLQAELRADSYTSGYGKIGKPIITVATIVIETLFPVPFPDVAQYHQTPFPVPTGFFQSIQVILQFHFQMHSIGASIYLEVELENALEETSVIQLELEKEFGGTGPHLEKVFHLLWSLLYYYFLQLLFKD